ncbi:MAG TPA: NAD-dependent epimerase/dehydratase family protein, partial [Acidobacteriota bacterium]|nr:NAD-dependent epimerase/dehydratase family protein [Acidobacteriota bacterium]
MKMVLPGGSGHVGRLLVRELTTRGHTCVVLSRGGATVPGAVRTLPWDARTLGNWQREFEGADAIINLAGRSVDCRYTERNLCAMRRSRVDSTRVVGEAIACCARPPRVWLQMATATVYAHRFDAPNDEATGIIGGDEPDVPALWRRSVEIARAWEAEVAGAATPHTRKVILRSAMVMSPDRGSVFDVLAKLCRGGLGRQGDGRQFVSWIHGDDFVRAI